MRTFSSLDDLAAAIGEKLGPGPWRRIDQGRVNLFAEATDDHQWIHLDPDRAATGRAAQGREVRRSSKCSVDVLGECPQRYGQLPPRIPQPGRRQQRVAEPQVSLPVAAVGVEPVPRYERHAQLLRHG